MQLDVGKSLYLDWILGTLVVAPGQFTIRVVAPGVDPLLLAGDGHSKEPPDEEPVEGSG